MPKMLAIKNKGTLAALILLALLFGAAIVLPYARQISQRFSRSMNVPVGNEGVARNTSRDPRMSDKLDFVEPEPQTGGQFNLSRNVIGGGGGTSSGGSLRIDGTIAETGASGASAGGNFAEAGGFWQTLGAGPLPTPTPSPTATPTPTPPPMEVPLLIFVAADNSNETAAIDSVTFVRGPFKTHTDVNFSADHQTRVLLFTTALGLSQSDVSKVTVTAGGISLTVENVGPLFGLPGHDASFIVVRLPDGLPPGNLPLIVIANGVQSTNSPTLGISPP